MGDGLKQPAEFLKRYTGGRLSINGRIANYQPAVIHHVGRMKPRTFAQSSIVDSRISRQGALKAAHLANSRSLLQGAIISRSRGLILSRNS